MTNIKRMYYPIPEASKILGCTIDELYHLGATSRIEICTYIPEYHSEPFNVKVNEGGEFVFEEIEKRKKITDRFFSIGDMNLPQTAKEFFIFDCHARFLQGFFSLIPNDIINLELDRFGGIDCITPGELMTPFYSGFDIHLSNLNDISIPCERLVIMAQALDNFDIEKIAKHPGSEGGGEAKGKPNASKQSKLIKALLEIQYGVGASNNINALINEERGTGELLKDLQLLGIKPPMTRKALSGWLDDIELDYVGNSTSVGISKK